MALGMDILIWAVVILVLVGLAIFFVIVYNGLIRLRNNIKKSWSNIDVLLKQRADELPKLIASVKGYMDHERGVLEAVTKARTQFMGAQTPGEKAAASNAISAALKSLFAVAENYPNLKANENFIQLQGRISGLENEISDRREFYNDSVNQFNIRIQSIPDVAVARMMNLAEQPLFQVAEADRQDVVVKF